MNNSFVFYRSFFDATEDMTDAEFRKAMTALMLYALDGEEPDVSGITKTFFRMAKPQVDANLEKKNKGGAPTGNQNAKKQPQNNLKTTKNNQKQPQNNQETTKQQKQPNVNVNDNANDNVNVNDNTFCPESETAPDRIAASFKLNDGSLYNVAENDVAMYQQLYPGIDCRQELRNIVGWCDANPTRRKTRSGAKRFINGWLAKAQNSAKPAKKEPQNQFNNSVSQREYDYDELERRLLEGR